ncbi:spore germination protein [Paenibacillus sp. sptzw28]|uniref:spore germination protein n=1 Tax=Paenibacillus sp. sptzw28 TaxID=715179 RepID=UPI001C6E3653|nr:spore germination protein [Paenibacillus sp. sptzw28]QYR23967.1 spore germination protein [Paenibacillus sp. sptzw28]
MIKYLFNRIRQNSQTETQDSRQQETLAKLCLKNNLRENIEEIKKVVGNSPDIVIREWRSGGHESVEAAIVYASGLADSKFVNEFIMEPLMSLSRNSSTLTASSSEGNLIDTIRQSLPVGGIGDTDDLDKLLSAVLSGDTIILCQGCARGLLIASKGGEDRGVQESSTQQVIRGPKEGFTENMATNISLVRRKIKDHNLWFEHFEVGRVTKTGVSVMYINGIVKDETVQEVRARIKGIDIDGILESGYIEEFIQDKSLTLFPTIYNTERPDVIAAGLLEGRIAIFVDGTPFVLLVPALFVQFFQAAEDYYQRYDISSFLRLLRYLALAIALLGPSLYIAVTTFHHEMLPPQLLISLSAQREGVPFPAFIEALLMEVTFELLREAGVRLPKAVGQAISIVGALVIGQAAVQAGIVSAAMVIVVSITAIASFVIPAYNMSIAIRILRFGMMGLAASFGLYGIIAGMIGIVQHLCHLRSFGVPYMSSFAPATTMDNKDTALRVSWRSMNTRPSFLSRNRNREKSRPAREPEPES